ncbi:MAG: DNA-3-methyladenine glycosylase 2 family protein [Clostridia bacterium]|nr:DNA-3-methyladenine glycosylase 2 family protein [Clostridia bacterium]
MFEIEIKDFDLKNTFDNGQCFRFNPYKSGYLGIAKNKVIYLEKHNDVLVVDGITKQAFEKDFASYFDLNRDYQHIAQSFPKEENLMLAIEYGKGMKILQQELWEALFSFVISQNNNIGRIKAIIERICFSFGKPVEFDGNVFYAFPTAEEMKDVTKEQFASFGCGYRSEYLVETVKAMLDGKINEEKLKSAGYFCAKEELVKLKGVGPKVADCVCLFGLNYLDAFPVDTWIKKVMEALFIKKASTKEEIWQYAQNAFGQYAGIAQQYLFYYARENKIKGIDEK